jgi:hypothetical protein
MFIALLTAGFVSKEAVMKAELRRGLANLSIAAILAASAVTAASSADRRPATPRSDAPRVTARSTPAPRAHAPATRDRGAPSSRTAPRATASGRATYGHYDRSGYPWYSGAGYYPYGYGWPWWSVGLDWGWYSWGPWVYAPPRYYTVEPPAAARVEGPARFELDVSPRRATVRLDGEEVGRAKDWDGRWDRLPVERGDHVLTFEAPGYKSLRVAVDATPGAYRRVSYALEKGDGIDPRSTSAEVTAPPRSQAAAAVPSAAPEAPREGLVRGFLRVKVTPGDAAVYLDGEYFARADEVSRLRGAIPLALGTHTIEVVRPGYESRKVDVEVSAGRAAEVELQLERGR